MQTDLNKCHFVFLGKLLDNSRLTDTGCTCKADCDWCLAAVLQHFVSVYCSFKQLFRFFDCDFCHVLLIVLWFRNI